MKIVASDAWEAAGQQLAATDVPPNAHVMVVSNCFTALAGILWSASYILMTLKAFKDKSYGMPIYSLCLNITWEVVYGFVYKSDLFNQIVIGQWLIVDVFLLVATIRFGPSAWSHTPMVAKNFGWIILVACIVGLWGHLALAAVLVPIIGRRVVFFTAWPLQVVIGVGSLGQIMSRGNTKGHSWNIWGTRALGTLAAASCFYWRAYFWPERFGYALNAIGIYMLFVSHLLDLAYPFVFRAVWREETRALHERDDSRNTSSRGKKVQ